MRVRVQELNEVVTTGAFDAHTAHVWVVSQANHSTAQEHLTADEQERAMRYKLKPIREQFIAMRSALRRILGAYLKQDPCDVALTASAYGKPTLAHHSDLHFNVSHSQGMGLIALATMPIGVDMEPIRPVENAGGLVDRYFAQEERDTYWRVPEPTRQAAFFRGWTCKEALLKGHGLGMRGMECCAVEMDPTQPARVLRFDGYPLPIPWGLATWQPCEGFVAALAVDGHQNIDLTPLPTSS